MQKPGSSAVLLDVGAILMLSSDEGGSSFAIAKLRCRAARSCFIPPSPSLHPLPLAVQLQGVLGS